MRHQDEKYDEFFRAHYDELLRFADKRLRCHQDAEDVAIRAMTTLWEQSLKNPSLLNRAWLFGVLKKLIFAELRRDKSNDKAVEKLRNREWLAQRLREAVQEFPEGLELGIAVFDPALYEIITRLPQSSQLLLELISRGETCDEIAIEMQCQPGVVRTRLSRLRNKIRQLKT